MKKRKVMRKKSNGKKIERMKEIRKHVIGKENDYVKESESERKKGGK